MMVLLRQTTIKAILIFIQLSALSQPCLSFHAPSPFQSHRPRNGIVDHRDGWGETGRMSRSCQDLTSLNARDRRRRRRNNNNDDGEGSSSSSSSSSSIPQLPAIGASSFQPDGNNVVTTTDQDVLKDDNESETGFVGAKFQLQYTCKVCETRNW